MYVHRYVQVATNLFKIGSRHGLTRLPICNATYIGFDGRHFSLLVNAFIVLRWKLECKAKHNP